MPPDFPETYRAARKGFIAACRKAGIDVVSRVHPGAQGPDGKPLFLDAAAIGPRTAQKALLLISGTHGVEGHFGSGVQAGLLREGLTPPPGARIVLVHALNPFGFAWSRRVNEDNVDINRNFIDHAHPPANKAYDRLKDAIAPRDISPRAMRASDAQLNAYAQRHGALAFQDALTRGQYRHPQGLFFGGLRETWSSQMLRAVLREDLARVKKVVVVDFHTGLGRSGAAEMSIDDPPGSPAFARSQDIWGAAALSSATGQSLSAALTGTIGQGLRGWLGEVELTSAVLEVGTRPVPQVLRALRRDNWLHNFADANQAAARGPAIAREMRAAFYCDRPIWKRAVWGHAKRAVTAVLAALA
jgi:hypothetical protein